MAKKMEKKTSDAESVSVEVTRPMSHIGLFGAVTFGLGSMIGSGIFVSPTGALKNTGSIGMSLIIWTVCGGINLLTALVYAELGCMMPHSGGDFNYVRKGLGDAIGFQAVWCIPLFGNTASMAVLATVFADYLLAWIFGSCKPPLIMSKLIAAAVILSLGIFNTYSARVGSFIQQISTVAKVIALTGVIIGGIIFLSRGDIENFENPFEGSSTEVQPYSLALYSCFFAYHGYTRIGDIADEIINPKQNIPRALFISIFSVTLLYVMTNVSFFTLLSKQDMLTSSAVGYDWALKAIEPAAFLMTLSVLMSVYGANNGNSFGASRVMFSGARAGHYPEVMSHLNVNTKVPVVSLFIVHVVGLLFLLVPGNVFVLINFLSFVYLLVNFLATVSLLWLRYKNRSETVDDEKFRSPIFIPILSAIAGLFLLITPFISDPKIEFLYGLSIIVSGVLVFIVFVHFHVKLPGIDKVTCFLQLLCNMGPTAKVD